MISFLLTACTVQDTENSAPTVQITSPYEGAREQEGVPFTVVATIGDDATANPLVLTWSIDPEVHEEQNPLRTEKEATLYLPDGLLEGTYGIALSAADGFGATAADSVQMNISGNAAPKVTIEEPADGTHFQLGDGVGVEVNVKPGNDSMADIWFTWGGVAEDLDDLPETPNAEGNAIYLLPELEKGRYKLSVTAHDQGSETGEDEVKFFID